MNPQQQRMWECVKMLPEKWSEPSCGAEGGGFWAVAILGRTVVWYNDIEDGFNCSTYHRYGVIAEYWADQAELEVAVQRLIDRLEFVATRA